MTKLPERPANTGKHPLERTRSKAEEKAVERLRKICLALPGVTEKISWGELTWGVGKLFAQMHTHHHGSDGKAVESVVKDAHAHVRASRASR